MIQTPANRDRVVLALKPSILAERSLKLKYFQTTLKKLSLMLSNTSTTMRARNHFLLELKSILLNTDKPKTRPIIEPFSMKQVMNRSENNSEPTITDLRHEVSFLKDEIRNIKSPLSIIESDIPTHQDSKKPSFFDFGSKHSSSRKDSDDDDDINTSNINNDHLVEADFSTPTGNNASTSAAPAVSIENAS